MQFKITSILLLSLISQLVSAYVQEDQYVEHDKRALPVGVQAVGHNIAAGAKAAGHAIGTGATKAGQAAKTVGKVGAKVGKKAGKAGIIGAAALGAGEIFYQYGKHKERESHRSQSVVVSSAVESATSAYAQSFVTATTLTTRVTSSSSASASATTTA